ncbi:MAG: hypothetical protein HQ592_02235, partial [Planctomycetes bacterium]|nr:hypothetical protein [Planctomycetota bacterium]
MRTISADLHDVKGPHDKRFRRCVAGGHAALGLRAHYQQQLALARKECGFEYIRLHGLLHDDMGVYREEDGKPIYGRQHVDKFYDFLLDIGIRPLVEFSLMPKALASGEKTLFYWRGNITPPTSYDKWQELIRRAVLHWERRYGREEIRKWYFEVWNEPNLPGFWTGTQEEYFALYRAAAQAVKSVCADYRIGGPATAGMVWITDTINFCNENNVALDFITSHTYGVDGHFDATGKSVLFISNHPHALWKGVQNAHDEIRQSVMSDLELHVTEWGTSYSSRDPVHDSYYSAAYILSKLKLCEGAYESMAYWTFSDVFEELRPPMRPFHGGFGLVTLHGLKKAGYFSYQWLNQLGNAELACDDADAWICCDDRGVQALFWNYTHLEQDVHNQLFFSQDQPPKAKQPTQLKLAGLKPGPYELAVHRAGYRSNDVYSDYLDLGSPDTLSRDEVEAMRQRHSGAPEAIQRVTVAAAGSFSLYLELRDNDVIFVKLTETGASQESLPVYKTVSHALVDHMGVGQFVGLQTRMVRWIIRNKVLEVCRLMGWLLVAIDGT